MNGNRPDWRVKHGLSRTPIYRNWRNMLKRCECPTDKDYARYGGRSINVCERWHSVTAFIEDMGSKPSAKHSIERKDNNLGYFPENCVWALPKEQARNRRNNRILEAFGKSMPLCSWAEVYGIDADVIGRRIKRLWPIESAISKPIQAKMRHVR